MELSTASGLLLRIFLGSTQLPALLNQRVEVVSPANSVEQILEGIQLLRFSTSPYSGSNYHLPPLLLTVYQLAPRLGTLKILIPAAVDLLTSHILHNTFESLYKKHQNPGSGWLHRFLPPSALYLWSPFTLLTCIAGSLSSWENLFIVMALHGAISSKPALAALALAIASYLAMHPILLLVPLALLIHHGPEALVAPQLPPASASSSSTAATNIPSTHSQPTQAPAAQKHQQQKSQQQQAGTNIAPLSTPPSAFSPTSSGRIRVFSFVAWFLFWSLFLLILSELSIRSYPQHMCLYPHLPFQPFHPHHPPHTSATPPSFAPSSLAAGRSCWMRHSYGFMLDVTDHTPNIGFFWYFFQEMFANFRTFFKFVFHSHSVIFIAPLAAILPHRPVFLFFVQLMTNCMFKPYPTVGDLALYTSLLPLFSNQLSRSKCLLALTNSLLLLLVLGPAMWHQWIVVESANANFFYSMSLLFGCWQTVMLVHLLSLTLEMDRSGKPDAVASLED